MTLPMKMKRVHTYEKKTFVKKAYLTLPTFRDETSVVNLRREKSSSRKLRAPLATMKTRRVNPSSITDTAQALRSFRGAFPPL